MCCRPTRECSRYVWLSAHQNSSRHCPTLSHNSAAALQNILMQHVAFLAVLASFPRLLMCGAFFGVFVQLRPGVLQKFCLVTTRCWETGNGCNPQTLQCYWGKQMYDWQIKPWREESKWICVHACDKCSSVHLHTSHLFLRQCSLCIVVRRKE